MGDYTAPVNRKGLFKRDRKGLSTEQVTVDLERGRIRSFSHILGEQDPIFTDVEAARAQGHPDIAAPPSFFMVVEALAGEMRHRQGAQSLMDWLGCDFRYLMHGEEYYHYEGLMYAGEQVSLSTKVLDFYDKRDGLLEFMILESTITHADRGILVRAKRTLLHRLG